MKKMQILSVVMKMKKTVSICILCVLALAILIGIFCSIRKEKSYDVPEENNLAQEQVTEETTEEILSSMQVEPVFSYVMVEEAGYLVVYERDMQQIFLETRIPNSKLDDKLQKEISAGKKFETEEAVYDFLENYSS